MFTNLCDCELKVKFAYRLGGIVGESKNEVHRLARAGRTACVKVNSHIRATNSSPVLCGLAGSGGR